MGIFEGCMLASDIDETLVTGCSIPKRNLEKIKFFTENGGTFVLATGRLPCGMAQVKRLYGNIGISLFGNGGLAYNLETREVFFEYTLPKEDYASILKVKELFPDITISCQYRDDVYKLTVNARAIEHAEYEELIWKRLDADKLYDYKLNKTAYLCESVEQCEGIKKAIQPLATGCEFTMSSLLLNGEVEYILEQLPKGVSKASGLLKLAKLLNIKEGSIYAIGDYFNDLDMISAADIGAATAGAPDEVKAAAKVTVGTAENGAVADFIDYLLLKRN